MDLVRSDADDLVDEVESELGSNANRLHPDVYMNELLVGMRMLHQVLPVILKKLNIEFKLDGSLLQLPHPSWEPYKQPAAPADITQLPSEAFPSRI
jgi:hypothetical protein